jgi:hypothetical protein
MRKRLYFVLPDVETAVQIEKQLLLAKIEDRHIRLLAPRGMDLRDIPRATFLQRTDIVHGAWIGMVAGGFTGLAVGIFVRIFPDISSLLGLGSLLFFAIAGAAFGIWVSGMISASIPNSQLKPFEKQLEAGKLLMMVDVPRDRVDEINGIIKQNWPGIDTSVVGPTIPAFP